MLCFKCDKKEHATDYQQEDSSDEKENEEVARTSDDVELVIHREQISRTPKNLVAKVWSKSEHLT